MEHTPGPWKVVDRFYIWTDDDVGCEVAKVCDENLDEDCLPQADADTRLIAAAPELLAVCQTVAGDLQALLDGDDFYGMSDAKLFGLMLRSLNAAIAKAEGRSEC